MSQAPKNMVQVGVRLPAAVVDRLEAERGRRSRAEYARELIVTALNAPSDQQQNARIEPLFQLIETLRAELADARTVSTNALGEASKAVEDIERFRADMATCMVGLFVKIGQAVREEDARDFAQKKAEAFVRRVFFQDPEDEL